MSRQALAALDAMVDAMDDPALAARQAFERDAANLDTFVFKLAKTLDEHDPHGKPKAFPDWPYLREALRAYKDHRLLLVEKCRQVMITWLFSAVMAWELRQPQRRWGWVSLKEEHADAALERVWFIITNLPGEPAPSQVGRRTWRDAGGVLWERAETFIRLPELHSIANAMSQTADDARSHTFTGMVFDEFAFMPQARAGYSAAKPTIDNGRCVCITTPGPLGFVSELYAGTDYAEVLT